MKNRFEDLSCTIYQKVYTLSISEINLNSLYANSSLFSPGYRPPCWLHMNRNKKRCYIVDNGSGKILEELTNRRPFEEREVVIYKQLQTSISYKAIHTFLELLPKMLDFFLMFVISNLH